MKNQKKKKSFGFSFFVLQNSDWDLKRTHVYHCHVSKEGSFTDVFTDVLLIDGL